MIPHNAQVEEPAIRELERVMTAIAFSGRLIQRAALTPQGGDSRLNFGPHGRIVHKVKICDVALHQTLNVCCTRDACLEGS